MRHKDMEKWMKTRKASTQGNPRTSLVAQKVKSTYNAGDLGSIPGSGKISGRRKWQPTPVFWPGKSHG